MFTDLRRRVFGEFWLERRRQELKQSQSGTGPSEDDSGASDLPPCRSLVLFASLLTIIEGWCTLAGAQHSSTDRGPLSKQSCTTDTGVLPKGSAPNGPIPGCGCGCGRQHSHAVLEQKQRGPHP